MNEEKYRKVFIDTFNISDESILPEYRFKQSQGWDSVGHMMLCACLEDTFDIRLNGEDILAIESFERGKDVLEKYGITIKNRE